MPGPFFRCIITVMRRVRPKILIVEDNSKLARLFEEALGSNFEVETAGSVAEARQRLDGADGLLLDVQLPDGDGLELIPAALEANPACAVVVVTAYGTVPKAVEAIRRGAADFMEKPVDLEALLERFKGLLQGRERGGIVAESPKFKAVAAMAEKVAPTPFPVLIFGETGSGKEVLARYIHDLSGRRRFVAVNCAAIPKELAESLLFGHRKGSFTGATESGKGLVESADGGTLFLDEIGEMPLELQPKLLRFLDTGTYIPLGEQSERSSDVRIIAATNRDLRAMCREGRFREDLFFRLYSFPIEIPPLRERLEDIEGLALHHLGWLSAKLGREVRISKKGMAVLRGYHFPGNVRELFNILDRAAILTQGEIGPSVLAPLLSASVPDDEGHDEEGLLTAARSEAAKKERELIARILAETGGNKAEAARRLNISYKTLYNKMKRLGMQG